MQAIAGNNHWYQVVEVSQKIYPEPAEVIENFSNLREIFILMIQKDKCNIDPHSAGAPINKH